jgi:hypothetical protein
VRRSELSLPAFAKSFSYDLRIAGEVKSNGPAVEEWSHFLNLRPISIRIGSEAMAAIVALPYLLSSEIESRPPIFTRTGKDSKFDHAKIDSASHGMLA